MTLTDIVILLIVGTILFFVIKTIIRQTVQGQCAGCSATKKKSLWVEKYKKDNHCDCGCHK